MPGKGTKSVRMVLRVVFCGLSTLVFLTDCGSGGIGTSTPPPISVTVSPAGASVTNGGSQTFTAIVTNDPADAGVTWNLSNPELGTLSHSTTISVTYTAPPNTSSPITLAIFATSKTDPTKIGKATIYI